MNPNVGKQFEQLPMFMTGGEIKAKYQVPFGEIWRAPGEQPGTFLDRRETTDEVFARKLKEAPGRGLTEASVRQGIQTPVALSHAGNSPGFGPTILDGHHRIAAAAAHTPNSLVPVVHI